MGASLETGRPAEETGAPAAVCAARANSPMAVSASNASRRAEAKSGRRKRGAAGRNEELGNLVASVVGVTCRRGRFGARGEAHAGEEIGRVGAARNVDDRESEFANGVEPARVVVADQPLPVQPLEAGVVRVELEWLVQEIRAEGAQRVHHGQELETVGGVAAFLDGEFA